MAAGTESGVYGNVPSAVIQVRNQECCMKYVVPHNSHVMITVVFLSG